MNTEFKRIQKILEVVGRHPSEPGSSLSTFVGLNARDDCAVLSLTNELDLVVGSDFIRGEGFDLFKQGLLSWHDLGWYLVGANVSDLAAMGATPSGILVVIRYPPHMSDIQFEEVVEGVAEACASFAIPLLGGDTGGYENSVLSATAFGTCPRGRALLRSEGRPGDLLFLTGDVGSAGAAMVYFQKLIPRGFCLPPKVEQELLTNWRRVEPPIDQGRLLVEQCLSRCAIDTSDGLKAACRQLAEASRVDVLISPASIPIADTTKRVARALDLDPLTLALSDSVDFRLLFSSPAQLVNSLSHAFESRGWKLFEIGRLTACAGKPQAYLTTDEGPIPLPGIEWSQSEIPTVEQLLAETAKRNHASD